MQISCSTLAFSFPTLSQSDIVEINAIKPTKQAYILLLDKHFDT